MGTWGLLMRGGVNIEKDKLSVREAYCGDFSTSVGYTQPQQLIPDALLTDGQIKTYPETAVITVLGVTGSQVRKSKNARSGTTVDNAHMVVVTDTKPLVALLRYDNEEQTMTRKQRYMHNHETENAVIFD